MLNFHHLPKDLVQLTPFNCVPLISKAGRTDRLFNFCLDPININSDFLMLRVNQESIYWQLANRLYLTSPDLKKPQWSRCRCHHVLGEYHRDTFLVVNLIND